MPEITTQNTEWSIMRQLAESLENARIDGEKIFKRVELCSDKDFELIRHPGGKSPLCVVQFVSSGQRPSVDGIQCCHLQAALHLALRGRLTGHSQQRLEDMLNLLASVRNAVESDPPAESCAWGDGTHWRDRLIWRDTEISDSGSGPWLTVQITLEITFIIDSANAH